MLHTIAVILLIAWLLGIAGPSGLAVPHAYAVEADEVDLRELE